MKAIITQINLPVLGIVAFSLASVNSIYHLLAGAAVHPSPILYAPSLLVELVTAWVIFQVVEQARHATKSRISKQDRRFRLLILGAFAGVALPLVAVSTWANTVEFGGSLILGALFPLSSIGCAVGASLPQVVSRFEQAKTNAAQETSRERKRRTTERKAKAKTEQAQSEKQQVRARLLSSLGKARATYVKLEADPGRSQADIAAELGISRQAVSQHIHKLEQAGVLTRNGGGGVEVLT